MSDQGETRGGLFRSLLGHTEDDAPRVESSPGRSAPPPPPRGAPLAPTTIDLTQDPGDRSLIEDIEGADPAVRRDALARLIGTQLTPRVATAASAALQDPRPDIRMLALEAIERAPRLVPLERLEAATLDRDPAIRARAVTALARTQRESVLTTIQDRLASETEESVIEAGLAALGQSLQTAARPFPPSTLERVCRTIGRLTAATRDRHPGELGLIARVVREADLVGTLDSDDDLVRLGAAILAFERGSVEICRALSQRRSDRVPEIRALAVDASSRIKDGSVLATEGAAGFDIGRFGRRADDVIKRVLPPGGEEKGAPGEVGPERTDRIGALAEKLARDPIGNRELTRVAFDEIGGAPLIEWAESYLVSPEPKRVRAVAAIVAHLGRKELIPFLAKALLEASEDATRDELSGILKPFSDTWRLIDVLQRDPSPERRIKGLRLATLIDPTRARPILEGLNDQHASVRMRAIGASGRVLTGEVVSRLLDIIVTDTSSKARVSAVRRFWDADSSLRVRAAEQALRTHVREARVAAVDLLSGNSEEELGLLARALHDHDIDVATSAISRLGSLRAPEALAVLWSSLRLVTPEVQRSILKAMEEFDREAVVFLGRQSLDSADPSDRVLGLSVLSRLETDSSDRSLMALDDPSPEVRMEALRNIQKRPESHAVTAVGARLRDPEPAVRALALQVLESIEDDRTLPYFVDGAKDPSPEVRRAAKAALLRHSPDAVVDLLLRALMFPSHRRAAADLLIEIGRPAIERLTAALLEASPEVARTIGEILRESRAADLLIERLSHRDPERRLRAVSGLGAIRSSQAVPALIECLRDPDAAVRARVANVLGDIGDARAIEPLKRAFIADPDMEVVRAIEPALRNLTEETHDA